MEALRAESPDCIDRVLETFAPDLGTRDVNAKLMSYLKKVRWGHIEPGESDQLGPSDDPLVDFQARWSLSAAAMERLQTLPEDLLAEVLEKFAPPPSTRDFSAKLMFFIDNFIQAEQHGESEKLQGFAEHWGLNDIARRKLCSIPIEEQEQVIREFNPGPNTRDVSGKLMGFIKAKSRRRPVHDDHAIGPIESFCQRWSLNEEAMVRLGELSPELQDEIIANFAPRDTSRDANPIFHSYLKSIVRKTGTGHRTGGHAQPNPLNVFAERWGLNQEAMQLLWEMPIDLQDELMSTFDPREGTRDMSSKFISFVKSKLKPQNRAPAEVSSPRAPPRPTSIRPSAHASPLEEFAEKWQLSAEAFDQLRALTRPLQDEAMRSFSPGPNTRDVNAKFMAYLNKNLLGKRARPELAGFTLTDEAEDFARRWGLSEEAVQYLAELHGDVREEVMKTFAPPADTRDMSRRFISYAKTLNGEPARKRQKR